MGILHYDIMKPLVVKLVPLPLRFASLHLFIFPASSYIITHYERFLSVFAWFPLIICGVNIGIIRSFARPTYTNPMMLSNFFITCRSFHQSQEFSNFLCDILKGIEKYKKRNSLFFLHQMQNENSLWKSRVFAVRKL